MSRAMIAATAMLHSSSSMSTTFHWDTGSVLQQDYHHAKSQKGSKWCGVANQPVNLTIKITSAQSVSDSACVPTTRMQNETKAAYWDP